MMKLFVKIVNNLLFSQKKNPPYMLDSVIKRPLKIMKFARQSLGGANRDCYNA